MSSQWKTTGLFDRRLFVHIKIFSLKSKFQVLLSASCSRHVNSDIVFVNFFDPSIINVVNFQTEPEVGWVVRCAFELPYSWISLQFTQEARNVFYVDCPCSTFYLRLGNVHRHEITILFEFIGDQLYKVADSEPKGSLILSCFPVHSSVPWWLSLQNRIAKNCFSEVSKGRMWHEHFRALQL